MKACIAAAALALSLPVSAQAGGLEAASLSAGHNFRVHQAPGLNKRAAWSGVKVVPVAGRPWFASISGTLNGKAVQLQLNRRTWKLLGSVNGVSVALAIDHTAKRITSEDPAFPVSLEFKWSPEKVVLSGSSQGQPVKVIVDFKKASLVGEARAALIKLDYDRETGAFTGQARNKKIVWNYDRRTGRMTRRGGAVPVDLTLVNLEMGDFLQYFFVLLEAI